MLIHHAMSLTIALGNTRLSSMPRATHIRSKPPQLSATNPCESAGWPQLQDMLDKVPVFTVANNGGQPLEYQVGERKLAVFYADVEVAKKEYDTARGNFPDLGYDMVAVGLGTAYKVSCEGNGLVVPGLAELRAAGAPEDAEPMGQELPLFACMEMQREGDDGLKVPLFVSFADCASTVAQASESAGDDGLAVNTVLSLQSVVEELSALADPASGDFSFEVPLASLQHMESYVGQGVYMRKVDEDDEGKTGA